MNARSSVAVGIALAAALSVAGATAGVAIAEPASRPQAYQQGRPATPAPAPAQPPATRGTSTITVSVVADDGTAVKRATVMLVAVPAALTGQSATPGAQAIATTQIAQLQGQVISQPMSAAEVQAFAQIGQVTRDRGRSTVLQKQARTNSGGVATFTDLPEGAYVLSVAAPTGYVTRETPPRVQVAAGGQAAATVKVARAGVVTGRVVDDEGDPVTGARVSVYRVTRAGRATTAGASTQPTNDLGGFRVWSLPAGDYLVSATYDDRQGPGEENAVVDGFVPTYYPGVAAFDAARPVQVRAGQESAGIDVQLVRGRLGAVIVRVVDSNGGSLGPGGPGASVNLVSRGRNPAFTGRGAAMRPDGTFLITNVPAGDYYLSATMMRGSGPNAAREGAYVPVAVNGDEVSVSLQTNTGATISGRVVMEGTPPAQSGNPGATIRPPTIRVLARPVNDGAYSQAFSGGDSGPNSGSVRPDGTFTLTGVRGPIQLQAAGGRAALEAVRRGAHDVSGQPIELQGTERIDDAVIVMTYDIGGIQGTVVDESDEPLASATVLVVPDDPDKWNTGSPFVRTGSVRPGGPGGSAASAATPGASTAGQPASGQGASTFQMTQLPPGRYIVIGVADASAIGTPDRQLIEQWRGEGTTVLVDAGQTAVVRVRGIK
jgi:hypothetical protein